MDYKKTICPFHKETTPSCVIRGDRFHCFGCGEGGSIDKLNEKLKSVGRQEILNDKQGQSVDFKG